MSESNPLLHPGQILHIYNHGVGKENLFERDEDYIYFLDKLKKYLLPVSDVLAYCLMPNHFHLTIRFKEIEIIKDYFKQKIKSKFSIDELIKQDEHFINKQLSQVCSNFFNTYAKHYNFVKGRTGTLFKRTFRRKEISDLEYLRSLICYIHQNPVESGFAENILNWKYSSYKALTSLQPTLLLRQYVINQFDDLENFKYCHTKSVDLEID